MTFSVQHDLHIHSFLSDCCHDERMIPAYIHDHAVSAGYDALCLTDHTWDPVVPGANRWYAKQPVSHIRQALPLPQAGLRFRFGCEAEYCGGKLFGLSREACEQFDFIIVPLNHFHWIDFTRPAACNTEEKASVLLMERIEQLLTLDLPWRKIGLAHLTCELTFKEGDPARVYELLDPDRLLRAFERYAERGAGIELNSCSFSGWEQRPEAYLRIYQLAKKAGCKFYCGSDAHDQKTLRTAPDRLGPVARALALAEDDRYFIPD